MYALVDCNNFYVSCERLFRPDLHTRPVLVLSNNDGCVVSRSLEAKRLGVKIAVPFFQIQDLVSQHDISVFSSNYALYGDISERVMRTLEALAPRVERYSIDEAFLDLTGQGLELEPFGQHLRQRIQRDIGMSVGVGIAPSKTLAKLANWAAKRWPEKTQGVVELSDPQRRDKLLAYTDVHEVWGVGRRLAIRLNSLGIRKAIDLAQADHKLLRKNFSVVLERTARELCGEPCFGFDDSPEPKKMIASTRSFRHRVHDLASLAQAVTLHVSQAAEKLRAQRSLCGAVHVYIRPGAYASDGHSARCAGTIALLSPSDDTRDLQAVAQQVLRKHYREGPGYAKAGVVLMDLVKREQFTPDLFSPPPRRGSEALMQTLDAINQRQGRGSIRLGRLPANPIWAMRRDHKSPGYTTRWEELPKVGAHSLDSCTPKEGISPASADLLAGLS